MIYFDLPGSAQEMVVKTHTEIKTAKIVLCTALQPGGLANVFLGRLEKISIEEVLESDTATMKTGSSPNTCFVRNLGFYLPQGISEL